MALSPSVNYFQELVAKVKANPELVTRLDEREFVDKLSKRISQVVWSVFEECLKEKEDSDQSSLQVLTPSRKRKRNTDIEVNRELVNQLINESEYLQANMEFAAKSHSMEVNKLREFLVFELRDESEITEASIEKLLQNMFSKEEEDEFSSEILSSSSDN